MAHPPLQRHAPGGPRAVASLVRAALLARDDRLRAPRIAVCHHDLWHDNLLRSEHGRLSGVLDIAHLELTDPTHDFAAPRYSGDAFMTELIAAYRAAGGRFDADDQYRADRFFEGREFGGLAWAIEHDKQSEIDAAIGKLVNGPLLRHPGRG
jgi:aminoglycoside phosphotransferase (APT) family kinase protein